MTQRQEIVVRRAKVGDAAQIAAFINRALRGRVEVDEPMVVERFGNVGFLLAERDDDLVGMLGWQAENLVVRVTDFLIVAVSERIAAGQALLTAMEEAAAELQCEAALLFMPCPSPPALVRFYRMIGYESQFVADLPKAWRDAAREGGLADGETVLVKPLRDKRVLRPL